MVPTLNYGLLRFIKKNNKSVAMIFTEICKIIKILHNGS